MDREFNAHLVRAASLVLRPLLRLCLHYGVGLSEIVEVLKRTFVDVAKNSLEADGKRATDSSLSIMTGVHRKDVRRILESPNAAEKVLEKSLFERADALWTGAAEFTTKSARPRALPRRGKSIESTSQATFEDLVESINKDVSVKALLDEWVRIGAVRLNASGHVVLNQNTATDENVAGMLTRMMVVAGDRLNASVSNRLAGQLVYPVNFVYGAFLEPEAAQSIMEFSAQRGNELARQINAKVIVAERRGAKSVRGTHRFSWGMHSLHEPQQVLQDCGFTLWESS